MSSRKRSTSASDAWSTLDTESLGRELMTIIEDARKLEQQFEELLSDIHPHLQPSARNLLHYLTLRRTDRRPLQQQLARLGLSSLGRAEAHVLATVQALRVKITRANERGSKLRGDRSINFPESHLRLNSLTEKDIRDLDFAAEHADIVGLSFIREPSDIRVLHQELSKRGARDIGIMLKIETQCGFQQLPRVLLEAMHGYPVGVMIARGDLAVECGWERMAEIQEEILWLCEAAHLPVVWATQVLENLAKRGFPSRAEITDAAMVQRAECVMLNKGPHILETIRTLDDILRRMRGHQSKKTATLRNLLVARVEESSEQQ